MSTVPIRLDFTRDFCARHREPLRAEWPRGAATAMVLLFEAFTADPRVAKMAPLTEDGLANADTLPELIAECSPLCCFVGDDVMDRIMAAALQPEEIE